jgi:putative tricarboxylic transport membrane protein
VDAAKVNYIAHSGGGEALATMLGGRVTAGVSGYGEVEAQVKTGRLRLVAITAPARLPGLDAPTLKEQGIDVVIANWRSVMAAPGIADPQKKALVAAVEKMAKSAAWAEILKQKRWDDAFLPGDEFAAFLTAEQARVTEVMRSIGLAK